MSCCFPASTPKRRLVKWSGGRYNGRRGFRESLRPLFTQHVVIDHMRDVTVVPPAGVFIADVEETLHYLQGKYYRDINRKLQINILYPGICFMFM